MTTTTLIAEIENALFEAKIDFIEITEDDDLFVMVGGLTCTPIHPDDDTTPADIWWDDDYVTYADWLEQVEDLNRSFEVGRARLAKLLPDFKVTVGYSTECPQHPSRPIGWIDGSARLVANGFNVKVRAHA